MRILGTFLLLMLLLACREQSPAYPPRTMPEGLGGTLEAEASGRAMFAEKCASCHGHPGEGRSARAAFFQPPAPVFSEHRYRDLAPDYLYWRIEKGKNSEPFRSQGSVMPAWGPHLSEAQIWELVVYLKTRAGTAVR